MNEHHSNRDSAQEARNSASDGARTTIAAGVYQQNADGSWTPAVPLRKATWLEVMLDRWIGPRHGDHPWRCVLKGLTGRG